MCSYDRKRFIVLQVKTMSSHQRLAGTREWNKRALVIDALFTHFDRDRLAAIRARRLDSTIGLQRSTDADCVPGAVAVPPPTRSVHAVGGRHGGKRNRHSDLVGDRVKHQLVLAVEVMPNSFDLDAG